MSRRHADVRGVATTWGLSLIGVLLLIGLLALSLVRAADLQHQVDSTADLAALSALETLRHGGDPCTAAWVIARANDMTVPQCHVDGYDVVVEVASAIRLPFGLHPTIHSVARAGLA